jgi:hypothetical protein
MKYFADKKQLIIDKEINELDKFVIEFTKLLPEYVLVSGYVSILTGRSRSTEDVDLLIPQVNLENFKRIWQQISSNGFECINTLKPLEAFEILKEHAIRFARKGKAIPNMEVKLIQNEIHDYSFNNKIRVLIGKHILFISPLEMQIAYKLNLGKMGNEKDLEDAKHLYELFKENLNKEELIRLIKLFNAEKEFKLIR